MLLWVMYQNWWTSWKSGSFDLILHYDLLRGIWPVSCLRTKRLGREFSISWDFLIAYFKVCTLRFLMRFSFKLSNSYCWLHFFIFCFRTALPWKFVRFRIWKSPPTFWFYFIEIKDAKTISCSLYFQARYRSFF